jgi:hypothetical protein
VALHDRRGEVAAQRQARADAPYTGLAG